jgi:hypothetical protein
VAFGDQTSTTHHRLLDEDVPRDIAATCHTVEVLHHMRVSVFSDPKSNLHAASPARSATWRRTG